ncbi:MAG: flavodoxin family protein, partial [Bdellovibrionaceae bacterium]|nr:flavodoxin family protein [Pseudobdellovibrionaceae bacterium]
EIERISQVAWQNYRDHRKAPYTTPAGPGFADPEYKISDQWRDTHQRLLAAQAAHKDSKTRVLVISGSPRNENSCPGEMPKSFRLAKYAISTLESQNVEVDFLDLSRITAEYGKNIHPCKACVSTAMPLCHWPCSCYPNHSQGHSQDWMAEIYEKWVQAHGVMIVTPVHWYGLPSAMKLMVDRLVCADGGNPDPTRTHGKNAAEAKALEIDGWDYPKPLAGRAFSVVVHGDTNGVDHVRRQLSDWLVSMELIPSGASGAIGKYIGYYEPYATSHQALDKYDNLFIEVSNAAKSLSRQIEFIRSGKYQQPDKDLKDPESK